MSTCGAVETREQFTTGQHPSINTTQYCEHDNGFTGAEKMAIGTVLQSVQATGATRQNFSIFFDLHLM